MSTSEPILCMVVCLEAAYTICITHMLYSVHDNLGPPAFETKKWGKGFSQHPKPICCSHRYLHWSYDEVNLNFRCRNTIEIHFFS
mmetsp:Transcript_5991/g.12549  ORF Transcript_5991/g.12549 Transcript_5991/m.12549 type:complete len:85 (-) Transcript_5991:154-408(-)